jgi:hypothetical protein
LALEAGVTGGYLRGGSSGFTIGCQIENDDTSFRLRPYDVAQAVRVPALGFLVTSTAGAIEYVDIQADLRRAEIHLANRGDLKLNAQVTVSGLWGETMAISVNQVAIPSDRNGGSPVSIDIGPDEVATIEVTVHE